MVVCAWFVVGQRTSERSLDVTGFIFALEISCCPPDLPDPGLDRSHLAFAAWLHEGGLVDVLFQGMQCMQGVVCY